MSLYPDDRLVRSTMTSCESKTRYGDITKASVEKGKTKLNFALQKWEILNTNPKRHNYGRVSSYQRENIISTMEMSRLYERLRSKHKISNDKRQHSRRKYWSGGVWSLGALREEGKWVRSQLPVGSIAPPEGSPPQPSPPSPLYASPSSPPIHYPLDS